MLAHNKQHMIAFTSLNLDALNQCDPERHSNGPGRNLPPLANPEMTLCPTLINKKREGSKVRYYYKFQKDFLEMQVHMLHKIGLWKAW